MRRLFTLSLIVFAILTYIAPFRLSEVSAESEAPCGVSHYNISDPLSYIYLGNTYESSCPQICPPAQPDLAAGHLGGDINSPVVQYWCAGSPLPPDKPAINAGQVCVAGDSRTVTIAPQGGTTHEIEINPGGVVNIGGGTSHTFTGLTNGVNYTFRAQSSDAFGSSGWSNWTPAVRHDTAAPATSIDMVGISGANGWYTSDVSVALLSTDSGCLGVSQTGYSLNGNNYSYSAPFNVNAEGINNLVVSATDGYHVEPAQNRAIRIDKGNPTLSLSPDRLPDASTGWWTSSVSVTINTADAISGVDEVTYALNSGGWMTYASPIIISADGIHEVDAQVTDVAGLMTFDGVVIRVDATPPTLSLSTDRPVDVLSGWWTAPVIVTINAADATSGLDGTVYSVDGGVTWQPYTAPFTLSADGLHTIDVVSRDQAGNINSQSATIGIDQTPPQMELAISAVQGENGWLVSQPVISLLNADSLSGMSEMTLVVDGIEQPYTTPVTILTEGEHTISFRVVDGAGHIQIGDPVTIYVDHIQPFGELQINGEAGSGKWYRVPPILRMSRTDSMSGVAGSTLWIDGSESAYGSAFQINTEGWHTIVYNTRDFAGNSTASQRVELGVDRTAPTIQDVRVTCGDSLQTQIGDSLSGVVRTELSVDGTVTTSDTFAGRTDAFSVSYPIDGIEIRLVVVDAAGNEARITRDCTTGVAIVPVDSPDESGTPPISGGEPPIFWLDETPETLLPVVTPPPSQTVIVPSGVELWADNQPQINPVVLTPPVLGEVRLGVELWEDQPVIPGISRLPVQPQDNAPRVMRSPVIWEDTVITPLPRSIDVRAVEQSAPPVGTDALPGALAALGALATVAAGVVTTTASAHQRQAEQASQRAAAEAALAQQVVDQAHRDDAKQAENASLREAAETIAYVDAAISDRKQMYYDLVSGYADRVRLWEEAQARLVAESMMVSEGLMLSSGSTIEDLPQEWQDLFWELGNMHYERADQYRTDVAYVDENGQQWAFQKQERDNLGYYQYLIRQSVAVGDLQKTQELLQTAGQYINRTLTDRVDRELAAVKNSVVSDVQSLQIAPFLPGQTLYDVTQSGLSLSDSRFSTRQDELTNEMEDRGKPQLFTYIDAQTANYRVNAVTDILRYHDQIITNQTPKNDILQSLSKPAPFAQQVSAPDTQGTLIELLQMAEGESETARLAQLEILNTLGVTLSSDTWAGSLLVSDDAWTDAEIAEVFEGVNLTLGALQNLADRQGIQPQQLAGVFGEIFHEIVGPVEFSLSDHNNRPSTQWLADEDRAVVSLPRDFNTNPLHYGEDQGRWLVVGELGMVIDARSFGTLSRSLGLTGIYHDGRQTSGYREGVIAPNTTSGWVFDEHGIFDFSAVGGPLDLDRHTFSNDTIKDEIREMFKQWVFFDNLLSNSSERFANIEDLRDFLATSQGYPFAPPEPVMFDYSEALYYGMQLSDYDDGQAEIDTYLLRNAYMDTWLSAAHTTSILWRDSTFQQAVLEEMIYADNIMLDPEIISNANARFNWYNNGPDLPSTSDITHPFNQYLESEWNPSDFNPTELFERYDLQRAALFTLLSKTDWANPPYEWYQATLTGESVEQGRRSIRQEEYYGQPNWFPPIIQELGTGSLAHLLTNDLPDDLVIALASAIDEYDQTYAVNRPDIIDPLTGIVTTDSQPLVANYNARAAVLSGMILLSFASEALDVSLGTADSLSMLLASDIRGAIANQALTMIPGAWGQIKRTLNNAVDSVTYYLPSERIISQVFEEPRLVFSEDGSRFFGIKGNLPGAEGLRIQRALTPDEMAMLTNTYGVEFGLAYEILPNGSRGSYWLFSGGVKENGTAFVVIPNAHNGRWMVNVAHTHPSGTSIPSNADIRNLTARFNTIIGHQGERPIRLQEVSHIIPVVDGSGRAIPYFPNSEINDYFPNGQFSQYYYSGGVDYIGDK